MIKHESFLHSEEFFTKAKDGKLASERRVVNFDEFFEEIQIDEHPDDNEKTKVVVSQTVPCQDSEIIGYLNNNPVYKNDDNRDLYKIPDKDNHKNKFELREKQFVEIDRIRNEMISNEDKRHLFFIPKGTFIVGTDKKNWFRGNINKDVLALVNKEKQHNFELKTIFPDDKLAISYFSREEHLKKIPSDARIEHGNITCIDLKHVYSKFDFIRVLTQKH